MIRDTKVPIVRQTVRGMLNKYRGGLTLPRTGTLFSSPLPNSDVVAWDEGQTFEENMYDGGWILPVSLYAALGTPFWFSDSTTPVARTGVEILAWEDINTTVNGIEVSFSLTNGLAVEWHRVAYIPNAYPFVDRDGANTRTLQLLHYLESDGSAVASHEKLTSTCVINSHSGTATIALGTGKIDIGSGTAWDISITYDDGKTSIYPIGYSTGKLLVDTSGNERNLYLTGGATYHTSREGGSDWYNENGTIQPYLIGGDVYSHKDSFRFDESGVKYCFYTYFTTTPFVSSIGYSTSIDGISWEHQGAILPHNAGGFGALWAPHIIKDDAGVYHLFVSGKPDENVGIGHFKSSSLLTGYEYQGRVKWSPGKNSLNFTGNGFASASVGLAITNSWTIIVEFLVTQNSPDYTYNALMSGNGPRFLINLQDSSSNYSYPVFYSAYLTPVQWSRTDIRVSHNVIHRIAYSYDGAALSLYLDGSYLGASAVTGALPAMSGLFFGKRDDATDKRYLNGGIFKSSVYNRPLTSEEIASQYVNDTVYSGLINHWDSSSGAMEDQVGSADMTVTNGEFSVLPDTMIGLDSEIYRDDAGLYHMIFANTGMCTISADTLDATTWRFDKCILQPKETWELGLVEGQSYVKVGDTFYLFYGAGESSINAKVGLATSTNFNGPYTRWGADGYLPLKNWITTQIGPLDPGCARMEDGKIVIYCSNGTLADAHTKQKIVAYTFAPSTGETNQHARVIEAGSAKLNILPVSNPSDTSLVDDHTYTLPDSHTFRTSIGWAYGVDHWAYTSLGVPKEVSGAAIKANGVGPRLYVGTKGIALYSVTYPPQRIVCDGTGEFACAYLLGTETITDANKGTSTLTIAAGKITATAGTAWSFTLSNGSRYEYATKLDSTRAIVFDISGNDRHLIMTGFADLDAACVAGYPGSDWINQGGQVVSDGTFYIDDVSFGAIPDGIVIPALADGSGCCAYVVGG